MTALTTPQLLAIMNGQSRTHFLPAHTAAASREYWRRVESGEHTRPPAVDVIAEQESPAAFTRRMLGAL